jgi:hypothetical protein
MIEKKTKPMRVYTVREFQRPGSEKTEQSWTLIGACFPNKKDDGFTIRLAALPLNHKLVVRPPDDGAKESADPDTEDVC